MIGIGRIRIGAALAAASFTAALSHAHDIVVFSGTTSGGDIRVSYGHAQDWQPIDNNRLVELQHIARDGAVTDLGPRPDSTGKNLLVPAASIASAPCVIAARYDNGVWTRLKDGTFRNARRQLVIGGDRTLTSTKYAKGQVAPTPSGYAPCNMVVRHRLEIVPMPGELAIPGGAFRVRVLWEGRPLPGVGVEVGDGVTAKKEEDIYKVLTDSDGYAQLTLGTAGWQIIAVDHQSEPDTPAVSDADMHVATFTFYVSDSAR
jgi:nickel transport protein